MKKNYKTAAINKKCQKLELNAVREQRGWNFSTKGNMDAEKKKIHFDLEWLSVAEANNFLKTHNKQN